MRRTIQTLVFIREYCVRPSGWSEVSLIMTSRNMSIHAQKSPQQCNRKVRLDEVSCTHTYVCNTHTHTHTRARAHTHTHTHTRVLLLFSRLYDVSASSCAHLSIILSSSSICLCHSSLLPLIPLTPSVL